MASLFLPDLLCNPAFVTALDLAPNSGTPLRLADHGLALSAQSHLPGLTAQSGTHTSGELFAVPEGKGAAIEDVFQAAGCATVEYQTDGHVSLVPMSRNANSFDAERWQQRVLPVWCEALPDLFSLRTRFTAEEIATRLPMILSRSDSRTRARTEPRPDRSGLTRDDVQLERQTQPYTEYFAVDEYLLRHQTYEGGMTQTLRRAVFMAADAVTILPYDPSRDRVLLVEQFRAAPYARGDRSPWLLEPIAGRIEPGDSAEETAHKEAAEEAGLQLQALHRIGGYYPSTGCFSEYLVSFIGIADLPDDAEGLHGVEAEGEDIRSSLVDRSDLLARIAAGEMPDGPLLLSAFWLELNRAKLLAS